MQDEWAFLTSGAESLEEALALAPLDESTLSDWTTERMGLHGQRKNEVVKRSRLNQTFAYQILSGSRKASRDKLIQLAFGLQLTVVEACELLERGGVARLLPVSRRDVIVAFSLARSMDVTACDDLLYRFGEDTLLLAR